MIVPNPIQPHPGLTVPCRPDIDDYKMVPGKKDGVDLGVGLREPEEVAKNLYRRMFNMGRGHEGRRTWYENTVTEDDEVA
jgi:hypothetical protein